MATGKLVMEDGKTLMYEMVLERESASADDYVVYIRPKSKAKRETNCVVSVTREPSVTLTFPPPDKGKKKPIVLNLKKK